MSKAAESDFSLLIEYISIGKSQDLREALENFKIIPNLNTPLAELGGSTLLGQASKNKDVQSVTTLLTFGSDPNCVDSNGYLPIHLALFKGCFGSSCENRTAEIVKALIEHGSEVNIPATGELGETPLYLAVHNSYSKSAEILLLNGADINSRCKDGKHLAIKLIDRVPDAFCTLLDTSIQVLGEEEKILLNFEPLLINPSSCNAKERDCKREKYRGGRFRESALLKMLLKKTNSDSQLKIFSHPLTEAFLQLKWKKFRIFHGFSYLVHLILLGLYTWFVVDLYMVQCPFRPNETIYVQDCMKPDKYNAFIAGSLMVLFVIYIVFGKVQNIFRLVKKPRKVDFLWICALVLLCSTLTPPFFYLVPENMEPMELSWEYSLSAIGILLMGSLTLTYIAQSPKGIYVEMFAKVVIKIIWLLFLLLSLLTSFGLAFVIMKFDVSQVMDFGNLIVGEPNYDELFQKGRDGMYRTVSILLFTSAITIISIALISFITGVAVGEVQSLEKEAEFVRNKRLVKLLYWNEGYLYRNRIGIFSFNLFFNLTPTFDIFIFKDKHFLTFSPYKRGDCQLTSDIRRKLLKIAKLKNCIHR